MLPVRVSVIACSVQKLRSDVATAAHWGSERDRQLWKEQADEQLAREPLWGPFLERTWRNNLKTLAELDASLL